MMNRKMFGTLAATIMLTLGLVLGGSLYAQQQGETPMGGMMSMMAMMKDGPMHGAMAEGPGAALEHQEELGLTAEQVSRLEALEARTMTAHGPAMEQMAALHAEIAAASSGERFDEAAVRAALDRMGDLHTDMSVMMIRTRHEVRAVLTSEQREKLAELGGAMMGMDGMMDMMGSMNMDDCPMMKGGMMGGGMEGMRMHDDSVRSMRHQQY